MFPKPYKVRYWECVSFGEDAMGNDAPVYAEPVDRKVYGWTAHHRKDLDKTETARDIAQIDLSLPTGGPLHLLDRFLIPGDDEPYDVVGIRDSNSGFHGWRPGVVAELRRVTG